MEGALLLMEFVLEHGKGPSSEKGGPGSSRAGVGLTLAAVEASDFLKTHSPLEQRLLLTQLPTTPKRLLQQRESQQGLERDLKANRRHVAAEGEALCSSGQPGASGRTPKAWGRAGPAELNAL